MGTVLAWQSIKEMSTRMYFFWVRCIVQLTLEQIAKSTRDCAVLQQNKMWGRYSWPNGLQIQYKTAAHRWPFHGCNRGKTSMHGFLRQLAEELREVYKQKRESIVLKHNEEEQSQNKREASKRHQCQVGVCKRNKTTEKRVICFKYVCGKCTKTVERKCTL
jgi:hypothetical protein